MKAADLVFALVPPALAILLQRFPIPSENYLAAKAKERQQQGKLKADVTPMILETTKGALAMASFVPTVVSFVVSAWALIYDRPDLREYGTILLVLFLGIGIVAASWLTKSGPFELSTRLLRRPFGGRASSWNGVNVINLTIYAVNLLLIALALAKWFDRLPLLTFMHGP
jgi:hypothetical protein